MGEDENKIVETAEPSVSKTDTYEFVTREGGAGWWSVMWRFAETGMVRGGAWETVAQVFGERRAEIVRDALSTEANERV